MTENRHNPKVPGFRILERVGEGRLGVVYKAEDLKLRRTVALKFLRADTAPGDERRARLLREAQASAVLDHPNICAIYGVGESEGNSFIVMAFVEGVTLRERIDAGPLPVEEAVEIARQMSLGLAAAHEKGIVHRDINPGNVVLSSSGPVKIMDFGLAYTGEPQVITESGKPTRTAGYMSPERARGEDVDQGADIWAFGVVLYEMLTGRGPVDSGSNETPSAETIHGRITRLRDVRPDTSPVLEEIVRRCLAERPDERPAAAGLVRLLAEVRESSADRAPGGPADRGRRAARAGAAAGIVLLVLAAAALWRGWLGLGGDGAEPEIVARRLTALPQDRLEIYGTALSPDGRHLALPFAQRQLRALDVIDIETGERRRIAAYDSAQALQVSWMPDGQTLMCNELQIPAPSRQDARVEIWLRDTGESKSRMAFDVSFPSRAAPSPDGHRVAFVSDLGRQIWIADVSGQNQRMIRQVFGEEWLWDHRWSPDGSRIAYIHGYRDSSGAAVKNLETCDLQGKAGIVIESDSRLTGNANFVTALCWLPDDRLLFGRSEELWSVVVDPVTGGAKGEARRFFGMDWARLTHPNASEDGRRLAFHAYQQITQLQLLELDEGGDSVGVRRVASQDWLGWPAAWTRDGQRLFYTVQRPRGDRDIYVRDFGEESETPFVNTMEDEVSECLTPDGENLLFWQGDVLKSVPVEGGATVDIVRFPDRGHPVASTGPRASRSVMCAAAPGTLCVLGQVVGKEWVYRRLSLRDGAVGDEVARTRGNKGSGASLSPAGTHMAIIVDSTRSVQIIDLADGSARQMKPDWRPASYPHAVSWFADGRSLCVAGRDGIAPRWIMRLALDGSTRVLWTARGAYVSAPRPAPDGSSIAFRASWQEQDVWMIEGF